MAKYESLPEAERAILAMEAEHAEIVKKLSGESAARRRENEALTAELVKFRGEAEAAGKVKTDLEAKVKAAGEGERSARLGLVAVRAGFRDAELALRLLDPAVKLEEAPAELAKLAAAYPALLQGAVGGPQDAIGSRAALPEAPRWGTGAVLTEKQLNEGLNQAVAGAKMPLAGAARPAPTKG